MGSNAHISLAWQFQDDLDEYQNMDEECYDPLEEQFTEWGNDREDNPDKEWASVQCFGREARQKKYWINFKAMTSQNAKSKKTRPCRRVSIVVLLDLAKQKQGSQPLKDIVERNNDRELAWQVHLDHGWFNLPKKESQYLCDAALEDKLQDITFSHEYTDLRTKKSRSTKYVFDLNELTQKNPDSTTMPIPAIP